LEITIGFDCSLEITIQIIRLLKIRIWSSFPVELPVSQELLRVRYEDSSGTLRKGNVHHSKPTPEDW
jgi:hypothetical protein